MIGKKVRVYRNLHKRCYSVKCMKTNRVIAHVDDIALEDVTFPVSKAGRDRVLAEGRKNVHAYVQGYVLTHIKSEVGVPEKICYNPYKYSYFFYCSNEHEIKKANYVILAPKGVFAL